MGRLNIGDLPDAAQAYDPEHASLTGEGKKRFESEADAVAEQIVRRQLLRRQASKQTKLFRRRDVRRLRRQLRGKGSTRSPASAIYMHDLRRRIAGALWALISDGN